MKSNRATVGRPQVAPEVAESFPLRLPPLLFAKLLAFTKLRDEKSVNTTIWHALEDWVGRQPQTRREEAERLAPAILAERRKKRAARAKAKAE